MYDFSAVDAEGNPITNFDEMLSITLSYDPADLGGLDEESLTINFYDELLAIWVPILSVVDLVNDTGLQQKLTISHCDEAQRVGGVHQGNYG